MSQERLTDAIASTDAETKSWKMRFSAAKGAYAMCEFRQCETLLFRAMEEAKNLKESRFAINTCHVGLGAVYIATGKLDEAEQHLGIALRTLSGSGDPALQELYAVALRFHAKILLEREDIDGAERDLEEAVRVLEDLGLEGAVQLAYVMSDLAVLYVMEDDVKTAQELIFDAMDLLEATLKPENPEYIRANIIYNVTKAENEDELLDNAEDAIRNMQYQRGQNHPDIVRALHWYMKKRQERGELDKIAEATERFDLHSTKLNF